MALKPIAERILEVEDYYGEIETEEGSGRLSGLLAYLVGIVAALTLVGLGAAMAFAYLGVPLSEVFSSQRSEAALAPDAGIIGDSGIAVPRASEKSGRAN